MAVSGIEGKDDSLVKQSQKKRPMIVAIILLLAVTLELVLAAKVQGDVVPGFSYLVDSGQSLGTAASWDVALGDLDDDGDLDAVTANGVGLIPEFEEPDGIWINDGEGFFSSETSFGDSTSYAVALGDLDNDDDLDAVVGTSGYDVGNRVWINDGTGVFTDTGQLLSAGSNSTSVVLGDLDGDMDLDVVVVDSWGGGNHVYLNGGSGDFVQTNQVLDTLASFGVALGDLDGDGDLDAFFANGTGLSSIGRNRVWFNDGKANFVDSGQILGAWSSRAVALGDLDGDGDLDAFVANKQGSIGGEANRVWKNNGLGVFEDSDQALGDSPSNDVVLADVDLDGDLDAIAANGGDPSRVWLNDGQGNFTTGQELSLSQNEGVAAGDLNLDGKPDLFFTNVYGACPTICNGFPNEVWFNEIQLHYLPAVYHD